MASLLKIDLSQIQTFQPNSRARTDSEDVRLNSPRNRASTRLQSQEGSKSAREQPLPRVVKDTSKPSKTAREKVSHPLNLSPLKIVAAVKPGLPLKKVDVFPASTSDPHTPNVEHTDLTPVQKQNLSDIKRHLHTSPKVKERRSESQPTVNTHAEDISRAFTAAPHRPEPMTATWGSFPQRQALRKQSDGLPDYILLARDRNQVEAELRTETHRIHRRFNTGASPNKGLSMVQTSEQEHGFERNSLAGGPFAGFAPASPTSSVHSGTAAGQVLFIPGSPLRTTRPPGAHKRQVDLHAQGESMNGAGQNTHHTGDNGEARGAPGSRNSVRVTLPSAAPAAVATAQDTPLAAVAQMSRESKDSAHLEFGPALRIVSSVPAASMKKDRAVPVTPQARAIHPPVGSAPKYTKGPASLGSGDKVVGTKALRPKEFLLDTEILERELAQELSLFGSLYSGYSQQPSLSLLDAHHGTPRSPLHNPSRAAASCAVQQLTVPASMHPPSPRPPFSGGGSAQKHRVLTARRASCSHQERLPLSSPMNDSPDKYDQLHQQSQSFFSPGRAQEGTPQALYQPSPARRRVVVSDALSGQRTAAVIGGLLIQPGKADLGDLLSGSTVVSTALAQVSFNNSSASPKRPPRPGQNLKIGQIIAVDDSSVVNAPAPLSPEAQAAVDGARAAALQQMRIPHALSPDTVLRSHGLRLTPAQREEVRNYPKVYFLGITQAQRDLQLRGVVKPGSNLMAQGEFSVYDKADGNYTATVGDQLRYRYEIMQLLGRGSFGEVYRCRDHKSGVDVAVKIIKNGPAFHAQADKERDVLECLLINDETSISGVPLPRAQAPFVSETESAWHQCVIQLVDSFLFRSHKCLVFPVHGRNLYEYLQDRNFRALPMSFVRRVAVQLFQALAHLRLLNIIHCDIKPENILLKDANAIPGSTTAADIVLTDFGSSCKVGEQSFTYIQSRFYRSPEVLLGIPYGLEIDVWSAACILPELRTSYPAFPGESSGDQLACIAEVLGLPEPGLLARSPRREIYFDVEGGFLSKVSPRGELRTPGSKSVETVCNARRRDADFVDFLTQCLRWEPERRLTPTQALVHPWLQDSSIGTAEGAALTRDRLSSVDDDPHCGDGVVGTSASGAP